MQGGFWRVEHPEQAWELGIFPTCLLYVSLISVLRDILSNKLVNVSAP
jgi:hypothetical protein